ncbi:MAG: hypothetical protein ACYS9X_32905 [Planctomycetota bacterium]
MAGRGAKKSPGDGEERELSRFFKNAGSVIIPLTVKDILEEQIARKLA